jgi:hypothetical protein
MRREYVKGAMEVQAETGFRVGGAVRSVAR